jgi:hypothetical protein
LAPRDGQACYETYAQTKTGIGFCQGRVTTHMPHVWIRYRLPDEQAEFDAARTGSEARRILSEIDQHCRSLLKHGEPTATEAALAERIRDMIRDSRECLLD